VEEERRKRRRDEADGKVEEKRENGKLIGKGRTLRDQNWW